MKQEVAYAPHAVITFDGWSTYRAESVLVFMVSIIKPNFQLRTFCIGNFKVRETHSASNISSILSIALKDRINSSSPYYFVIDSAPVNKAAVRSYMKDSGDTFWFPCPVHFAQLAMREAVKAFLNGSICNDEDTFMYEVDDLSDDETASTIAQASNNSSFDRITTVCRSIRSSTTRSHSYSSKFSELQVSFGINRTISSDVVTRSDSTSNFRWVQVNFFLPILILDFVQ